MQRSRVVSDLRGELVERQVSVNTEAATDVALPTEDAGEGVVGFGLGSAVRTRSRWTGRSMCGNAARIHEPPRSQWNRDDAGHATGVRLVKWMHSDAPGKCPRQD